MVNAQFITFHSYKPSLVADLCAGVTCNALPAGNRCGITPGYCVGGQCYFLDTLCTQSSETCLESTGTCLNATGQCDFRPVMDGTTCSGTPINPCEDPATCKCQGGVKTFAPYEPSCSSAGGVARQGCTCAVGGANGTCDGAGNCSELAACGLLRAAGRLLQGLQN